MMFLEFAELCARLETISGRLETISVLAQTIASLSKEDLPDFCRLIQGRPFPEWSGKLGVGPNLLYEAVAYVTGRRREDVIDRLQKGRGCRGRG